MISIFTGFCVGVYCIPLRFILAIANYRLYVFVQLTECIEIPTKRILKTKSATDCRQREKKERKLEYIFEDRRHDLPRIT